MEVLAEDEYFVQLSHLLEPVTVQLASFGVVSGFQWLSLQSVNLQEFKELAVSTIL